MNNLSTYRSEALALSWQGVLVYGQGKAKQRRPS